MHRPPIDENLLRAALGTRWSGVSVVDETRSTNAELLADDDAADRSVLVAEHQLAGRGRLDRAWTSPARAGLTFSVLLRPDEPVATWGWLPLLAGVALQRVVRDTTGVGVALKWPNDLLHEPSGLKLAGILTQTRGPAVVIGIGLNVTTTADELPVETASSLSLCGAGPIDRTALLAAVLDAMDVRLTRFADAAGDAEAAGLAADYRSVCSTLGRRVAVTTTAETRLVGAVTAIESDGRIRLAVDGGDDRLIGAGDVEHLRAAP